LLQCPTYWRASSISILEVWPFVAIAIIEVPTLARRVAYLGTNIHGSCEPNQFFFVCHCHVLNPLQAIISAPI
jgi:hypothetical protein